MGRRRGEGTRTYKTAAVYKHGKPTLFARENEEHVGGATEDARGLNGNLGELPLFYATSPKLIRSRPVGRSSEVPASPYQLGKGKNGGRHGRREVGADVNLGDGDAGCPRGSRENASWAGSFRFEQETQDARRLQAMLERAARISLRNLTDSQNSMETPGGSVRFGNEIEELSGNSQHGSHLKPPRHLEKNYGSNRFTAVATANHNRSEKQGGCVDAAQSSGCGDVVPFEARRDVAVDVPNSPERAAFLQRLSKLKLHPSASPSVVRFGLDDITSPSLLRFGLSDVVSYHKEMAKLAARRDQIYQRLKTDSGKSSSSTPVNKEHTVPRQSQCKPKEITALGELEIMPIAVERRVQCSSPSGLRTSPRRTAAKPAQELNLIAPTTSRFKQSPRSSSCSIQDQIVSIRKLQSPAMAMSNVSIPSPDCTPFLSAARGRIPFKWEEEPGKPKVIATANAHRARARTLSREGMEVSNCMENIIQLGVSQKADADLPSAAVVETSGNGGASARSPRNGGIGNSDEGLDESHRYYGRAYLRGQLETSLGQSSRRYSTQEKLETQIDLDASAAAKFLVQLHDTPLSTPGRHSSSPMFAVPFKWEDAPGKAKVEMPAGKPNMLQLPPRLAVPSYHSAESFSQDLRASHPFAGFFAPCLTASSPGHQHHKQNEPAWGQCTSSKSLPPRAPTSPPERRKRHGLVGRCRSTPREGCQIRVSKSTANSPVLQAMGMNLFSAETENSSSWMQENSNPHAIASPRSILCGPDGGSNSSQTSASNVFSSGDLDDFTQQTNHSGQSASKSSSSFESIEVVFAELPGPAFSNLPPLHSGEPQVPPKQPSPLKPQEPLNAMNSPLNLSKTEKRNSQKQRQGRTHSPEPARSPTLANYFQCLELTQATPTSTSAGAPTSSGHLKCEGEPTVASKAAFPTIQTMPLQQQRQENSSAQASPKRPTRLPYTMPSVTEQLRASCDNSARRQLIQDLSPRLMRQYSGRRLSRSSHGHNLGGNTPAPRVERYHADEVCPSPAYAAALQLLSPPVNLITQRRKGLATTKLPLAKPRRRARFMLSICKTLKRIVLGRQRRCKTIEPKLMYDYALAPTAFQFFKPN